MRDLSKAAVGSFLFLLTACYSGGSGRGTTQIPSLMSPSGMESPEAASKNNEGVDHLVQGHYDVAEPLFRQAIAASPNFAEAHFNLGVALDGLGKHPEATEAFKKAMEQGGGNPKIAESEILKKHLSM